MEERESRSLGSILWRRKWIILALAVLALGVSTGLSVAREPQYRTSALLLRDRGSIDITLFGTAIYQSGDVERDLITTAQMLRSERVAVMVKEATGLSESPGYLLSLVEAHPSTGSNTIEVVVTGPDPEQVAMLAEGFASQTILLRQQSDKAALVTARQALEAQIAMMTPTDLESTRGQGLEARIEQLRILEQVQTGGYTLWQPADVPSSPVSPRPIRDGAAGLAVGLVLGLVLALIVDRVDRRLKEYSDFEREFRLPVLALVPRLGRKWKRDHNSAGKFVGFANSSPPTLEAYRLLRSNLQYFEIERGLRSILITSGLPQEAKTVTACNLALSLALSGARVVLVDSDLRNPLMHRYLGLQNGVGLSTVLAGAVRVEDAVQIVKTDGFLPRGDRRLANGGSDGSGLHKDFLCVTSGPLPPNPAELLSSSRMMEILKTLTTLADHVLIDSAPLLLVADAVSIASRVDGVIVVSRANSATIDQAREIRGILDRVGARLVGLVISGVKVSASRGYKQGYYQKDS